MGVLTLHSPNKGSIPNVRAPSTFGLSQESSKQLPFSKLLPSRRLSTHPIVTAAVLKIKCWACSNLELHLSPTAPPGFIQ